MDNLETSILNEAKEIHLPKDINTGLQIIIDIMLDQIEAENKKYKHRVISRILLALGVTYKAMYHYDDSVATGVDEIEALSDMVLKLDNYSLALFMERMAVKIAQRDVQADGATGVIQ